MPEIPGPSDGGQTIPSRAYREPLIFDRGAPGRSGASLPTGDMGHCDAAEVIPEHLRRSSPPLLPEVAEPEVVRHYVRLSQLNHSVDLGMYPLGSCTMKYNPRVNEALASQEGFTGLHPLQPESTIQGALELMWELSRMLAEISGFAAVSLQPAAGAHGELTGLMMIREALADRGEERTVVLVPESAHGTNPASAALNGFTIEKVPCTADGLASFEEIQARMGPHVAAVMITNPSTAGLFEVDIARIADLTHEHGAYLYCDGANLNAILGRTRPGDWGADVMQFNLHKTFSTPHGGGGPGSGPVGVAESLEPYLPTPVVVRREDGTFGLDYDRPGSIGRVRSFFGNFGVMVKAYAYLRELGRENVRSVADAAVLNARYLLALLEEEFPPAFDRPCMHEFVLSDEHLKDTGVKTLDIAKRLLDYGYHAPTVYFPLIVHGAIMIEPTETESREEMERFAKAMLAIAQEARTDPDLVKAAPHLTPAGRMDEARAARRPVLRWEGPGLHST